MPQFLLIDRELCTTLYGCIIIQFKFLQLEAGAAGSKKRKLEDKEHVAAAEVRKTRSDAMPHSLNRTSLQNGTSGPASFVKTEQKVACNEIVLRQQVHSTFPVPFVPSSLSASPMGARGRGERSFLQSVGTRGECGCARVHASVLHLGE